MTGGSPKSPAESPFRRQPLVFVLLAVVAGILADARLDWPIVCEWLSGGRGIDRVGLDVESWLSVAWRPSSWWWESRRQRRPGTRALAPVSGR